ncbi:MAG: PAS domain S-box protein, partial [Methanomicrobiales archaeon]|nr:PAS domain S-box protein [Methanomicrobiales archaeon]
LLTLAAVLGTTIVDYLNSERNFRSNAELLRNQTEQDIVRTVEVIDAGLKVFDDTLNQQMRDGFVLFMAEYERAGRDPARMDLENVKQQLGGAMELYVINSEGVVEYSTYEPDLGLDFKESIPYFYDYLNRIRTTDGFYPDRVVQEKTTADLKKYAYMPTPDHEYVLELGLVENAFNDRRNQLRYSETITDIASRNPFIEDVRIYTTAKRQVGNRTFVPTPELERVLDTILEKRAGMEVENPESGRTLRYLFIDLRDEDYSSDMSLIVELTYNTALIQGALNSLILSHLLVAVVVLLASLGVAVFVSRFLTRPVQTIVEDVDRIARGDLDRRIAPGLGEEFSILGQSINAMVGTLKGTIQELRNSQKSLRESEERYRAVVEGQTEFITRFAPDGTHLFVNEAYCRYFGKPCTEIVGTRFRPGMPPPDRERVARHLAALTPERPVGSIEHPIVLADGSIRWQQWNDRAFFDDKGKVVEYLSVGRDITHRRMAEEALRRSEEKYRELVESANSIILRLDPRGHITFFNEYAQKFFGYTEAEILGRNAVGTIIPEFDSAGRDLRGTILDIARNPEKYATSQNENIRRNGERAWISWTNRPIYGPEGEIAEILCIGNDITAMRQAEEEIRQLNEELERRVIERTRDLEYANRELESFTYSVSHDLRAPLRAMDGFSRILLDAYGEGLPPEAREYLGKVRQNAQKMARLIDDLLNFSRMGRQALHREPILPADLAREAYESLESEREGRAVEIAIEDLPTVSADRSMLRQVFQNLLSNALKFTRIRPVARIRIGSCNRGGRAIYFVQDNGVGFDMQYAGQLFGVFHRLHPHEYEGSGVGLAIVKRIVERHGGRVWVESEPDRGTTFFFTLDGGNADE